VRFLRLSTRPPLVRWALWLLLADFMVSLLSSPLYYVFGHESLTLVALVFIPVFSLVWLGLVLAIAFGRRWAVVIYILLFVGSGYVQLAADPSAGLAQGALAFIWGLLSLSIDTVAVALLLMPSSRAWFAASKAARRAAAPASAGTVARYGGP
jgi:hypothetical protein